MKLPRHAEIWAPGYIADRWKRAFSRSVEPARVWLTIADHYEPLWRTTDMEAAKNRVRQWEKKWPEIASRHRDSADRSPRYTFFYPEENYEPFFLDPLAEMTNSGIGDVEIHLHHDGESQQAFIDRMSGFIETLSTRHGLLRRIDGKLGFAFIHGNFALDNSNGGRWCGLNNEITLLRDVGCYADFTMPSGGPTQARLLNTIYWAIDDPSRPKSYDAGPALIPGVESAGDLMMIPGPFGLRWKERLVPRIELGELSVHDRPSAYRIQRWLDLSPRIGRDIFVKLFTHGAQEANLRVLLGGDLDRVFELVREECGRRGWCYYFATAWEMFNAVHDSWGRRDPVANLAMKAAQTQFDRKFS
ncbi:MAG: hypothetical protein JO307_10680 [Bryobacterales bacterium]|nr:hypothetical protein [Bryobacterales bacterium]MBV9397673.1 hypothetical protein [Bryobacterales bacterium]